MRIVLLGLAGAGKGTQAQTLSDGLKMPYVSSGDLFRRHQSQGTELGLLAKGYMERGELVPDEVTIGMILDRIGEEDCQEGFILDGFPRTLAQAKALDRALAESPIDCAAHIKVGEEELVRRLSNRLSCRQCGRPYQQSAMGLETHCPACGGQLYQRADDAPEVVRKRIQVQLPELSKLVRHYGRQKKLVEVDGEQGIEEVSQSMMEAVSRYAPVR